MIGTILAVIVYKKKRSKELYDLFYRRMAEYPEYFSKNNYIKHAYIFALKLVRYSFHLLTTHSPYLILQSS